MGAIVSYDALLKHYDAVAVACRSHALRNDDTGPALKDFLQRRTDSRLRGRIKRAGRVVQQQNFRLRQ